MNGIITYQGDNIGNRSGLGLIDDDEINYIRKLMGVYDLADAIKDNRVDEFIEMNASSLREYDPSMSYDECKELITQKQTQYLANKALGSIFSISLEEGIGRINRPSIENILEDMRENISDAENSQKVSSFIEKRNTAYLKSLLEEGSISKSMFINEMPRTSQIDYLDNCPCGSGTEYVVCHL